MTRLRALSAALLLLPLACAPVRTPELAAAVEKRDCRALLLGADQARAQGSKRLARELATACPQAGLDALVAAAKTPAEAFLWCGRARAALLERNATPSCAPATIVELTSELKPLSTLGPADSEAPVDPLLKSALAEIGPELKLLYDHEEPVVFVGKVTVTLERSESQTITAVADASGKKHQVPATLHRVHARAEIPVDLGARTRVIHATEEARDLTWEGEERMAITAKFTPQIAPEDELKKRAVHSLLRNLARALRQTPPESIEPTDVEGCLAYGVALAVATGDRTAAVSGHGDPDKVEKCEKILDMPPGAGIPVP